MCIYCGKSYTNKEVVDKHKMCHTREKKKQLDCKHCEKGLTQYHTQILSCDKPKSCNIMRNQ